MSDTDGDADRQPPPPGAPPRLRHRRDGILPTTAAALSLSRRDHPLTGTATRWAREPELHPIVREVLAGLGTHQRERHAGRCPEAALLSRCLVEAGAQTARQARRALKHARITTRHIRENGDPQHGAHAPHCRSCAALLHHFGVRSVRVDAPTRDLRALATPVTPLIDDVLGPLADAEDAADSGGTVVVGAVVRALAAAGWRPGRQQIAEAERWADTLSNHRSPLGHEHALVPAAFEAWAEYGGLVLHPPAGTAGLEYAPTPVVIDPLRGLHWARTLGDLGRALGTDLSPLGADGGGGALLAVDPAGRVYCLDHTGDWYLGPDVPAALATLLTGARPHRLVPEREERERRQSR